MTDKELVLDFKEDAPNCRKWSVQRLCPHVIEVSLLDDNVSFCGAKVIIERIGTSIEVLSVDGQEICLEGSHPQLGVRKSYEVSCLLRGIKEYNNLSFWQKFKRGFRV